MFIASEISCNESVILATESLFDDDDDDDAVVLEVFVQVDFVVDDDDAFSDFGSFDFVVISLILVDLGEFDGSGSDNLLLLRCSLIAYAMMRLASVFVNVVV